MRSRFGLFLAVGVVIAALAPASADLVRGWRAAPKYPAFGPERVARYDSPGLLQLDHASVGLDLDGTVPIDLLRAAFGHSDRSSAQIIAESGDLTDLFLEGIETCTDLAAANNIDLSDAQLETCSTTLILDRVVIGFSILLDLGDMEGDIVRADAFGLRDEDTGTYSAFTELATGSFCDGDEIYHVCITCFDSFATLAAGGEGQLCEPGVDINLAVIDAGIGFGTFSALAAAFSANYGREPKVGVRLQRRSGDAHYLTYVLDGLIEALLAD